MFEQDYIMRIVREMIRVIMKLLFDVDVDTPSTALIERQELKDIYENFQLMADHGKINEAENALYELVNGRDMEQLKVAVLFYSHLNDLDDDYLDKNGFSREEVQEGLQFILRQYGYGDIAGLFLPKE